MKNSSEQQPPDWTPALVFLFLPAFYFTVVLLGDEWSVFFLIPAAIALVFIARALRGRRDPITPLLIAGNAWLYGLFWQMNTHGVPDALASFFVMYPTLGGIMNESFFQGAIILSTVLLMSRRMTNSRKALVLALPLLLIGMQAVSLL